MLDRWSLSRKLTAMIAIPVVVLVVFAGMDLARRVRITTEMGSLEELTLLAMASSRVGGALHQERSLTAGGGGGSGTAELQLQRERTDQAVAELSASSSVLAKERQGKELAEELESALTALGGLENLRQRVDSGELATVAAVSAYNDLSRTLLPVVTTVARRSTDVEVKNMLVALDLLARIRESADLERAALNFAFSSGMVSRGVMQAAGETVARQDTLEQVFLGLAPEAAAADYRDHVLGDPTDEVRTFRLLAEEAVDSEQVDVDPRQWWRASSVRITAMGDVEEGLVAATIERVGELRAAATRAAWFGAVVVLLAVGGVILLSTFVARGVDRSLTRATDTIRETVAQITASVQQLSASTGETAAAVTQTSTTVDELRQTSEAAARKARSTSESADESRSASGRARSASERGVSSMAAIRSEVEGIAERIVDLSERNAQISDIVQNVNAIAEQSNLLAVNASIEAAKAGEHGRGFAVVASEVRTLAERSKEATEQIRSILGEIQRSSNAAVMATEQGVKRVDEGSGVIDELGDVVQSLAMTIEEGAEASQQISLISSQQLTGIEQITEALRSVEQAASDNAAGAEQLAQAAKRLAEVSRWIATIVAGAGAGVEGHGR